MELCAIFFGTFQLPICCTEIGGNLSAFGVICHGEIETNNLKVMLPAVPVCCRRPWRCDSPRAVKRAMRTAFHSGLGRQWDDTGSCNGGCWRIEAWMFKFL